MSECKHDGCTEVARYRPMLRVWCKADKFHEGSVPKTEDERGDKVEWPDPVIYILDYAVCGTHATVDPAEFVPSDAARAEVKAKLNGEEPDFETMKIQYLGNHRMTIEETEARNAEIEREKAAKLAERERVREGLRLLDGGRPGDV